MKQHLHTAWFSFYIVEKIYKDNSTQLLFLVFIEYNSLVEVLNKSNVVEISIDYPHFQHRLIQLPELSLL